MAADTYGYDPSSDPFGAGGFGGGFSGYGAPGMPPPVIMDPTQAGGGASGAQMPPGMDPRIWALFQKNNKTPTGPGTGITDWQYWQNDAVRNASGDWNYVLDRLGKDLAGNGPDQGGGGSGGGSGSGAWSPDPRTDELYNMLMGRATQSLNVNPGDPLIRQQVDSYSAADTRQQNNYLSNLAERGGNANLGVEQRMSSEKIGQDTAGFQGQLMQNELSARRAEIAQALSSMGSLLTEQERLSLQHELALMDNALGKDSLAQRAYEWDHPQFTF